MTTKPIYCKNTDCAEYSKDPDALCDDCNLDHVSDVLEPYILGYKVRQDNKKLLKNTFNRLKTIIKMKQTKNTQYLTEDNGVQKYTLVEGNGSFPSNKQLVKVHYSGTLIDNTQFDSSYDRDEPFEFELGSENIIELWNIAIPSMSKGEKAVITGTSKYCYKDLNMPNIPPNSTLKFTIELLDVYDKPRTMEEMTESEKTTLLEENKNSGKDAFMNNELTKAFEYYTKAQSYAENLNSDEKINIYNNLSLITYKLEDYINSLHYADLANNIDNTNIKTIFRLANIHFKLSNYEVAIYFCNFLLEKDNNNLNIKRLLKNSKVKKKMDHEKSKNMFKKMFV
jgi:hypothetical protein